MLILICLNYGIYKVKELRIAIVTNWFPAGAGYVSYAYRKALESQGYNVHIYARGGKKMKEDAIWDDEMVTWAPVHKGDIITNHLVRWLRKKNINCVLFNEQRYWKPIVKLKERGFFIGAYVDYYTQNSVPAFSLYDFLICNTERHYSVFNWHPSAINIPWGTDIKKYAPNDSRQSEKVKFIISAGWQLARNADRRGSLLALDAFVRSEGEAELLFYSQTPLRNTPKDVRSKILHDDRVRFIEGTFDPFPYNEGDVYLYPSRLDGIGLTVPEALSSGLAVISTDCAPMNEFVKDRHNGLTVEVAKYLGRHDGYYWAESIVNSKKLVTAIQEYIDNPETLKIHKMNARRYAIKNLDWDKNSMGLMKSIRSLYEQYKEVSPGEQILKICKKLDEHNKPGISTHLRRAINVLKADIVQFK